MRQHERGDPVKAFLSSVITGFEQFRAAAAEAAAVLGIDVIRAEQFGASPASPQGVCLAGVRAADVVLLLMGERYGIKGPSGLSPTHEEFREAKEKARVLVFVQDGINPDADQQKFLAEVQDWRGGQFTAPFKNAPELRDAVTAAMHQLVVSEQGGAVDTKELVNRATSHVSVDSGHFSEPTLTVVVAGGPHRQVIRPGVLEDPTVHREITRAAMFGDNPIFAMSSGSHPELRGEALIIRQEAASLLINEIGDIRVTRPALVPSTDDSHYSFPALVYEDVLEGISSSLGFASELLDKFDEPQRLSNIAVIAAINGARYSSWTTRAESRRRRSSTIAMGDHESVVAKLSPAVRQRGSLRTDRRVMAEDLATLLRRKHKS